MNFLEQRHQAEWSPLHRGLFHRLVAALRDKLDGREEALTLALQETEERAQECGEFLAAGLRLHACAALALARAADGAELEVPGHAGSCDGTEVLVAMELAAAAGRPDLAPGVAVRHQAGFPLALIPQNGGLDSSHQPASPGETAEARDRKSVV